MSSYYFGLVELIFVFGLALAFYVWQMNSLNRDIAAREERERIEDKRKTAAKQIAGSNNHSHDQNLASQNAQPDDPASK